MTKNKADWTYGRFEIRAKLPQGDGLQGIWPAIWMLPTPNLKSIFPQAMEVDYVRVYQKASN